MSAFSSKHFDVNILQDALILPNLELTFPLPTDKKTYLPLESNVEVSNSFQMLEHFILFFSKINVWDIYSNGEYKYSVKKTSPHFNELTEKFMKNRLQNTDEKLDEIVYKLIDLEMRMNFIKPKDFPQRYKEVKNFMVQYYTKENEKNLPKFGSLPFIRVCYITVIKTLKRIFPDGVWVNRKQFSDLYQKYLENPMSIALMPNHQSHIDYVILHIILIRFQMSFPIVIAGENLNVAIFGRIMKGLGSIFIKRSFNNELYTERNLNNYLEFAFLNKIHFEVFIEGTRSRDGKLLLPKYGILKTLASIYFKQRNKEKNVDFDLLIQPISIRYERVYETDGYLDELIGRDKKQESFVNILSNGLSNMFGSTDTTVLRLKNGFVDNSTRKLQGKLFVNLAESFKLSSFASNPANFIPTVENGTVSTKYSENTLNLKKLSFKILHSINDESYLPPCALVGLTIQTYYYLNGEKKFEIAQLIPMLDFLIKLLKGEMSSLSNLEHFETIEKFSEYEKVELIKSQVVKFFRFTTVNPDTNVIQIVNSFELLYYKNLCLHLIIHKCLVAFILQKTNNLNQINKLNYIFTGFLKNEFLFDHDYNPNHTVSSILNNFQENSIVSSNYEVLDQEFITILSTIIQPFIQSFSVCVDCLNFTVAKYFANALLEVNEQQLVNDDLMLKTYPTTKALLKILQRDNLKNFEDESKEYQIETYNKQYLLSFLFYLNNLELIKIYKNKSKTKAYVMIRNSRDLKFVHSFLTRLSNIDDSSLNYMIDVVDKTFDRDLRDYQSKF